MKTYLFLFKILLLALLAINHMACTDNCEETRTYRTTVPVSIGVEELRKGVQSASPQALKNIGKIYVKDNYLFINELKKGIHIIDNSNPEKPTIIAFLSIPGTVDIAVKDNILYADSYMDMVAIDITNPKSVKEVGRVNNVFQSGMIDGIYWYYDPNSQILTDYEWKTVTETVKTNCGGGSTWSVFRAVEDVAYSNSGSKTPSGTTNTTGQGGSMARFTIYDNYLYAVSQSDLILFNIKNLMKPDKVNSINLGWGIETIFPYKDKLFIGSNTGMYIFDNKNPEKPERMSIFQHARACDPVVVENDKAYVTLRTGICGTAPNQLDIVNIADLSSPKLIKSYTMQNPHGLGIDFPNLFVCEGEFGLKSFDVTNSLDVQLQQHIEKINAFDVIPMGNKHLIMVGKDGLYQYDYSNTKSLRQLSFIAVNK